MRIYAYILSAIMTFTHTTTRTYATLEVSDVAFKEIHDKLAAAGYDHAFHRDASGMITIDMHGIGLQSAGGDDGRTQRDGSTDARTDRGEPGAAGRRRRR